MRISFSKEWLFVVIWSVLVVFIANIPYIYGYILSSPERMFMGDARSFFDTNTYLAWIHQAEDGHILFKNIYTTEPHSRIFFHPFFLLLGNIARVTGLPPSTVHAWARVVIGFLLLLFLYVFISYFIEKSLERFLAFIIVSISGGFAWLKFFSSLDKIPESWFLTGWVEGITLLSIYALPLFSVSILMLLASFYFLLRSFDENKIKYSVYAGIIAFFLILTHSYDVFIVYAVTGFYILGRYFIERNSSRFKSHLLKAGIFISISIAAPIYGYGSVLLNPVFRQWAFETSKAPSPAFIWYLGLFGFLSILSVIGAIASLSDSKHPLFFRRLFLVVWAFSVPFLIYAPLTFQRRLIEGVHIPLSLLSVLGIFFLMQKLKWDKRWAVLVFILLLLPGNLAVLFKDMNYLKQNVSKESVAGFLDKDIYTALQWLESNTGTQDVVLADYEIGNYIPAISGNTVYIGHSQQTIDFWGKWALVKRFFDKGSTHDFRKKFLKSAGIAFIVYSWKERKIGKFNPEGALYLKTVYSNETVSILRVYL